MASKTPAVKTAPRRLSLRQEVALRIAERIYGSTVAYEILDQADGVYAKQVLRVSLEFADLILAEDA